MAEQQENEQNLERSIITNYFNSGFTYDEILYFLHKYQDINISERTLRNRLRLWGLKRRNLVLNGELELELRGKIRTLISGSGLLMGYRRVWKTLKKEGYQVKRSDVARLLGEVDPEGVQERRRRRLRRRSYSNPGPNYCWHVDGYDKLKPFGFPVHGAVDGFSRKILWLKVSKTNNDPSVTGKFYLDFVKAVRRCPTLLCTDPGTENGIMAAMQCFLRSNDDDDLAGTNAHRYCSSNRNQRIECFWSSLKKGRCSWWINFFNDLVDQGEYNPEYPLQKECMWYCFSTVLQTELDNFKDEWNTHYIRRSRYYTIPGRPDSLYYISERIGYSDQQKHIEENQLLDMERFVQDYEEDEDSTIYHEYFDYVMENTDLEQPNNFQEALHNYKQLLEIAQ